MKLLWNYKIKEFDEEIQDKLTDENAIFYIPQTEFARAAYTKYRKNGLPVTAAIEKVNKLYNSKNWRLK